MSEEKDWIQETLKEIEKIKSWKPSDRLSLVSKLTFMNGTMAASVTGWNSWVTNPLIMEMLTEEELQELIVEFEKLTIAFLDLDLKYTKLLKNKQNEAKKLKSESKPKASYVA